MLISHNAENSVLFCYDPFKTYISDKLLYESNNSNWQGNFGGKMALSVRKKNILNPRVITASLGKRQLNKDMWIILFIAVWGKDVLCVRVCGCESVPLVFWLNC